jgi:hypothetical protein
MKYRYLICIRDSYDGGFRGTNDTQVALDYAQSEDFGVVDVATGEVLLSDGTRHPAVDEDAKPQSED